MNVWIPDTIWTWDHPQRWLGFRLGTRMTVIRMKDGGLFVHSPVTLTEEVRKQVEALGPIRYIVEPNMLHHLYLKPWQERYPKALNFAPPKLRRRYEDLRWERDLGDTVEPEFAEEFDQLILRGSWFMEEVVFFHKATKTLLVGDIVMNCGPWSPIEFQLVMRLYGNYDKPMLPTDWAITFWDRTATDKAIRRLLAWDFDKILLAHGAPVPQLDRVAFDRRYQWMKRKAQLTG
jgi:hypothetical protein